ncbi:MAG: TolC family protein [Planctomycetota bacterium]
MKFIYVALFTVMTLMSATARAEGPPAADPGEHRPVPGWGQLPEPESLHETGGGMGTEPDSRQGPELTLSDLERMALRNNPTLARARAAVRVAQGTWRQAGLYPNPVAGYAAEEMGDEGTAGKQGGFVGQELVTAGKLRLNREVARQEIVRAREEVAAQQLRVLTDVQTSFYAALVAQRTIELTNRLVKIAEEGVEAAEALLRAQEASRVDLLQARMEANSAKVLLRNARNRRQGAWRKLAVVAGVPDMPPEPLAGEVEDIGPPLRWEQTLSQVLSESPEVAAATADVQAAQWAARRARVEWVPNVDVEAAVQHDNVGGRDVVGVRLGVPLPLFDRNQGGISAADAQLVSARRSVDQVHLDLRQRLAAVFRQYANARQQAEHYRDELLPDAQETLELVREGYQQGEFGYLELLTVQRTYFQNSLAYLDSLLQLRLSRARIEGLLLDENLTSFSESGNP